MITRRRATINTNRGPAVVDYHYDDAEDAYAFLIAGELLDTGDELLLAAILTQVAAARAKPGF